MWKLFARVFAVIVITGFGYSSAADVRIIEARKGGAFELHIYKASDAVAVIVMLEGAAGEFVPGGRGFVNTTYIEFVAKGYTVAVVSPPKDQKRRSNGLHPKFRGTPQHAKDIAAAVKALKAETGRPVWVLGVSRGTLSVANFASHYPGLIAGAVFMSSATRTPPGFKSVTDYDLSGITGAVLAVAHEDDGCKGTPPGGARRIAAEATKSKHAKALLFDGGNYEGKSPCGAGSHLFSGIEDKVVNAVASFIREHTD